MKFPKLVIDEATALRKHATKVEKDNLNFDRLRPQNMYECVYGQMTGNCFSSRAVKLIEKCCSKVYARAKSHRITGDLNGSPKKKVRGEYWSPIEVFIDEASKEDNKKLLSFIKGEIKSL